MTAMRGRIWGVIGVALVCVVVGIAVYWMTFFDSAAAQRNQQALTELYTHDHAHFGVAMVVGFLLVAVMSFGLFWLLAHRRKTDSVA